MATRTTRTIRFSKAIVEWLRSNAALVAFANHTNTEPRIVLNTIDVELDEQDATANQEAVPCVQVTCTHLGANIPQIDGGPFRTMVQVDCYSSDDLATATAMDSVYLQAEPVNGVDVKITTNSIRTTVIEAYAPLRTQASAGDGDSGVFVSTAVLLITWYDTATD